MNALFFADDSLGECNSMNSDLMSLVEADSFDDVSGWSIDCANTKWNPGLWFLNYEYHICEQGIAINDRVLSIEEK